MLNGEEISRCLTEDCHLCKLYLKLLGEGAEAVAWSDLKEHTCQIHILFDRLPFCAGAMKLDTQDAKYRHLSKGTIKRMCDFAALTMFENNAEFTAIELKSGAADIDTIEQLEEGIRILDNYFDQDKFTSKFSAYLVVGRQADKLKFALRDKLANFIVGSIQVRFHVVDCGDSLTL